MPAVPRRLLVLNERDPDNPRAGGAEVHVFEICQRLVARGHHVQVLAASFPGAAREVVLQGVHVRRLVDRHLYYPVVPLALRRELRRRPYDLVIDVLNKLPFFSPWFIARPCLAIAHHLFGRTAFAQVAFPIALTSYLAEKLIPRAYRGVPFLAISPSTKDDLVARGIAEARVTVVPPGLDHEAYCVEDPSAPRAPRIVWIGRLEHYKRADVVIDALPAIRQRVPDARLVVIGTGAARADLERRVRQRGLDDIVEFTGFLHETTKIAQLRQAAVLVSTSAKEGWGLTVIEGSACGAPSVAADVPGLRDSVRDGETGLLVPYGDPTALAAAVTRVLTDAGLRARLVAAGLAWAARFNWHDVTDASERLIDAAIVEHTAAARP